jgi:hypothetical protein
MIDSISVDLVQKPPLHWLHQCSLVTIIVDFLLENPSGHKYNHSFLHTFSYYSLDGGYDDISEEDAKVFLGLFK